MPLPQDLRRLAALATDAADRLARDDARFGGQGGDCAADADAARLSVLLAEMQALMRLLPPEGSPSEPAQRVVRGRSAAQTDAEVEAGFDNMPI